MQQQHKDSDDGRAPTHELYHEWLLRKFKEERESNGDS